MPRVENLFAATALAYLALGLYTGSYSAFTVLVAQRQVPGLRLQVPFYCFAALFGMFAFLYSIGYIIPFSPLMAKWHFWLSFVGAGLCIAGGAVFWFGAENAKDPWTWGVNTIVFSVAGGLLMFLSVQLWFAFDLARAVLNLRKS
jgi:hypothetical protein